MEMFNKWLPMASFPSSQKRGLGSSEPKKQN